MAAAPLLLLATLVTGPAPSSDAGPDQSGPADRTAGLRQALARAITAPSARRSLRLHVECRRDGSLNSTSVFGDGIGIWNGERQFRLPHDRVGSLLRALREADFPALEDTYGGTKDPQKPAPSPGGGAMPTLLTCRVELALNGYHKQAAQLATGRQSPVLQKLAEELLAICEPSARTGLGASSLHDGLKKVASGELAPETWVVVAHRKPGESRARGGDQGFLLTISGAQATSRSYAAATGYQAELVLDLSPTEARGLARELDARNPAAWPANLYAGSYTDLSLQVLNHQKAIQARPFAGMGPTTHGKHQKAFEQAFDVLERLHRRVLRRGRRGESVS